MQARIYVRGDHLDACDPVPAVVFCLNKIRRTTRNYMNNIYHTCRSAKDQWCHRDKRQPYLPCECLCFHYPFSGICWLVCVIPILPSSFCFLLSSGILHFPFLTATALISMCSSLCGLILNRFPELSVSWSKADACQKHQIIQGSKNKETQIKTEGSSKRKGWILVLPGLSGFLLPLRN